MNEEKKYEVVKFVEGKIEIDVNVSPNDDTVWMSLDKIAQLFERDKSVVSKHIRNIFESYGLEEKSVVAKNAQKSSYLVLLLYKYY